MTFEKPPYIITNKIVNLIADISALLPMISPNISIRLRKDHNIRSVHSSLAIENNTLSLEQMTDVINGRRVVGSPSEILEVKGAFLAYSQIESFEPCSIDDFLKAHKATSENPEKWQNIVPMKKTMCIYRSYLLLPKFFGGCHWALWN
jgi:Fic family protein